MNRKFVLTLFAMLALVFNTLNADVNDGKYPVKVSLLKAYEEGISMGNGALLSDATVFVNNGNAKVRISFVPLELNGLTGFLGGLWVNGTQATVISTYDDTDDYNDPEYGIDDVMKGKKYPRTVEFPINLDTDTYNCSVYVPVMGELGFGEQEARIKISYPEGFGKDPSTTPKGSAQDDGKGARDESKGADGSDQNDGDDGTEKYYTIPVQLWHATQDKESMGNAAITNLANIHSKNGKMTLYIGSSKMDVANISAALVSLYYDNGKEFVKANAHSYNLKVDAYDDLRPEVFSLPLNNKNEYTNIWLDPKVEPMGDDPIKARLKLDFSSLKEIKKDEASLIKKALSGKTKPAQDLNSIQKLTDKGIKIEVAANTFDTKYTFYANQIRGENLNKYKNDFDSLSIVKGFKLSALGDLDSIPYDAKSPINDIREAYQPKKAIKIFLPIEENAKDIKLYAFNDTEKNQLEYEIENKFVCFEYDKFEPFILVYNKDSKLNLTGQNTNSSNAESTQNNSEYKNDMKNLMQHNGNTYENKAFIMLFIVLMVFIFSVSIFFIKKYYKLLKRELYYAEELKIRLQEKQLYMLDEDREV